MQQGWVPWVGRQGARAVRKEVVASGREKIAEKKRAEKVLHTYYLGDGEGESMVRSTCRPANGMWRLHRGGCLPRQALAWDLGHT